MSLAGLYAITPDTGDSRALIERVRAAMQATAPRGWAALQYRNKHAGAAQRETEAHALAALCREHGGGMGKPRSTKRSKARKLARTPGPE